MSLAETRLSVEGLEESWEKWWEDLLLFILTTLGHHSSVNE